MSSILIIAVLFMAAYGIRELYLFAAWVNDPEDDDMFDDEPETEPANARKIFRDGFVYYSPIENELENDCFEWSVNRFRVEGEGLKHDKNFGKTNFDIHFDSIDGIQPDDPESV